MSKGKIQAFAETVSKSEELQKQWAAIEAETARSRAEKLAKISESAGTPFTTEEYLKSVAESSERRTISSTVAAASLARMERRQGPRLRSVPGLFVRANQALS
jgi:hypothetical protein